MQNTPVPSFFAELSAPERAALCTDAGLRTLQAAFASIPDPRKRRGQRYDLPFLLICLGTPKYYVVPQGSILPHFLHHSDPASTSDNSTNHSTVVFCDSGATCYPTGSETSDERRTIHSI